MLTEESRAANFTNEGGVDGTIRYLRNVMGLWLLQECLRELGRRAGTVCCARPPHAPPGSVVDPDDPVFLPPGDMPARIARCVPRARPAHAGDAGRDRPVHPGQPRRWPTATPSPTHNACPARRSTSCTSSAAARATQLLCQLTADACGLPVLAGPVEATALGNVLVQARAVGAVHGTLADLRSLVRESQPLRRYLPR